MSVWLNRHIKETRKKQQHQQHQFWKSPLTDSREGKRTLSSEVSGSTMTIASLLRLISVILLVASLQGFSLQQASQHHGLGAVSLAVPGTLFPRIPYVERSSRTVLYMSKGWSDVGSPKASTATTKLQGASASEMTLESLSVASINEPQTLGERLAQQLRQVDVNEVINTSIVFIIAGAVLYLLTAANADINRGWTVEEMGARVAVDIWDSYIDVLRENPVATKAATSASVYAIGDVIAQRSQGTAMGDLDRPRVLRSLLAGGIGHGPLSHYWYEISEHFFDNVLHMTQWWSFIPKVVVDQTVWGPIWYVPYLIIEVCDIYGTVS